MEISIKRDGLTLRGILEKPDKSRCPAVIMFHGFAGNVGYNKNDVFAIISSDLKDAGIASVRFDFNGHGKSDGDFTNMNILNELNDAVAILEYVKKLDFVEEIYVLGHSQGGVVGGMIAGYYPDAVKKLVLIAPAASLKTDALQGVCMGVSYDTNRIPDVIRIGGIHDVGGHYFRIAKSLPIYEVTALFSNPSLLLFAQRDEVVGLNVAEEYKKAMRNGNLKIYPRLNHALDGEDRMDMFNDIVEFLSE